MSNLASDYAFTIWVALPILWAAVALLIATTFRKAVREYRGARLVGQR